MTADDVKNNSFKINRSAILEALLTGSASSAITTVIYQPLELIKTRLQLRQQTTDDKLLGRAVQSAKQLTKAHGLGYLWRGTGAVSLTFLNSNLWTLNMIH